MFSENLYGLGNQQVTFYLEEPQRLHASHPNVKNEGEDIVQTTT